MKRSKRKFNQVDVDHAQGWLIRVGKVDGGIIFITKTYSALSHWALSYNLRLAISEATKTLLGLSTDDLLVHNEAKISQQKKYTEAASALKSTLQQYDVMSKDIHQEHLHSLCTKDLATSSIQEDLLHANHMENEQV